MDRMRRNMENALGRSGNEGDSNDNDNTPPPYHPVPFAFPQSVLAKKAKTRKGNGKKGKGTAAPMSRMENGDTGRSGRTRKPSQKLIEAAEAAQEKAAKAVAKAEAAQARAAKAAAAAAMVAQEEGHHNAFAKMLRQSQLEGPQFSMGLPINLPKLPRRKGGKRRTVRRRR